MERDERKKRILFMIPSLYGGGAERVCCVLASALAEKYEVLILYRFQTEKVYPIDPRVRITRLNIPDDGPFHPMQKILRPVRKFRGCQKVKAEYRPDAAVSFLYTGNLWNVMSGGKCRIICSERNNPLKAEEGKRFFLTKRIYSKADCVVFQSSMVRDLYNENIKKHSVIIRNPVRVGIRASDKRSHRIINMGRLVPQKNQSMLIRSFAGFHQLFPDYTLTIYGSGPLLSSFQQLAKEMRIEDYVFFPGNIKNIHQDITDAQIFVLSSDYEGLSNALLECMDMGIACISTACEGSVDVISDGKNGLLVPVGDEKALTDAMIRLAKDEIFRKRIEEQAVKDMKAYKPELIVEQWESVLFG